MSRAITSCRPRFLVTLALAFATLAVPGAVESQELDAKSAERGRNQTDKFD